MKKYYLIVLIVSFAGISKAQIDTIDFDTTPSILHIDTSLSENIWQVGKPQKTIFDSAYAGVNAIVTDTLNPYPVSNFSQFTIDVLVTGNRTTLSFWHRYDTDTLADGGYIEIIDSVNNQVIRLNDTTDGFVGGNWNSYPYLFETHNLYGNKDSISDGGLGFSGKSDGWIESIIIFRCAALKTSSNVKVRFTFLSDSVDNARDGWIIDRLVLDRFGMCSSIGEKHTEDIITISPNPIEDIGWIDLSKLGNLNEYEMRLININGQEVMKWKNLSNRKVPIDTKCLPGGLYLLEIAGDYDRIPSSRILIK